MVNLLLTTTQKTRSLFYWDAQNLSPSANDAVSCDEFFERVLTQLMPHWQEGLYKAWVSKPNGAVAKKLRELDWRVSKSSANCDEAIQRQALSDAGQDPENTTVFLITRDGDYAGLIEELRRRGVEVYLIAPSDASRSLIDVVGPGHWIQL